VNRVLKVLKVLKVLGVLGVLGVLAVLTVPVIAHHEPLAKFDDKKPVRIRGVVSLVDWRNPHAHIFVNVAGPDRVTNWAVEIESPIDLEANGWSKTTIQPGDKIAVSGLAARDNTRQMLGKSVVTSAGKEVFTVNTTPPPMPLKDHPTPAWPDGQPRLGSVAGGVQGYWAFPSATALVENGVNAPMDEWGLLKNIADAPKVAPMQPWALQLYKERQARFLRDDPMYLNCKPPGGPRQFQLAHGVTFVEDRARQRIFVLIGSGNNNYRIINLDGRGHAGQVGGDDDNPLYYGRSVGKWEGNALAVDTRGFNEDFWFTNGGLPHTDQLRLLERFSRPDFDTLKYEVTIEDPGAYTRTWSTGWSLRWVTADEPPRHLCQENRS
jgi:hypothetical protein